MSSNGAQTAETPPVSEKVVTCTGPCPAMSRMTSLGMFRMLVDASIGLSVLESCPAAPEA